MNRKQRRADAKVERLVTVKTKNGTIAVNTHDLPLQEGLRLLLLAVKAVQSEIVKQQRTEGGLYLPREGLVLGK